MNSFRNAEAFFHNCESAKGWEECKDYVTDNANFSAQSEALAGINKVKDYVNWLAGLSSITMPGCSYKVHASSYDESTETALFFATFTGTHLGEGGPIPPTNKTTNSGTITINNGVNGDIEFAPNGTGIVSSSRPIKVQDGSAVEPTFAFTDESTTGMFRSGAAEVAFTVNGNERMKVKNNTVEGISFRISGTDTAANPGYSFTSDTNTGIYSGTNDTVSFTTGGTEKYRIGSLGELLIGGTSAGTSGQVFTSGGSGAAPSWKNILTSAAPSSASDSGTAGSIASDANYFYVCTATDTWKRVAIASW